MPAGLHGPVPGPPVPGPPAPWEREARAIQLFWDEWFPGIKEGKFGLGWAGFSFFILHSSLDHQPNATLPPPSLFLSTRTAGRGGGWLILRCRDVLIFRVKGNTTRPDLHGASLLLRSTSRITVFPIP